MLTVVVVLHVYIVVMLSVLYRRAQSFRQRVSRVVVNFKRNLKKQNEHD